MQILPPPRVHWHRCQMANQTGHPLAPTVKASTFTDNDMSMCTRERMSRVVFHVFDSSGTNSTIGNAQNW